MQNSMKQWWLRNELLQVSICTVSLPAHAAIVEVCMAAIRCTALVCKSHGGWTLACAAAMVKTRQLLLQGGHNLQEYSLRLPRMQWKVCSDYLQHLPSHCLLLQQLPHSISQLRLFLQQLLQCIHYTIPSCSRCSSSCNLGGTRLPLHLLQPYCNGFCPNRAALPAQKTVAAPLQFISGGSPFPCISIAGKTTSL